ncbi:phosphonate C-P lyase system protein PhnG [Kinneretia asaccharophila]|uniref:Alpha-D-ribose 1-methylphosphonate 5-triphosphate synthase subunit PhnG n=1 Tax=Roseateles asaccharophilus TaxID=582607 RepID=A0A4R6NAK1_9BURK|nr:phosphonate C-P lyase system protein PhnG [Roseateles asaccharophilus]MDN3543329.1 phosphonate C-P lyase system protein PhnG [Roseateles asaccharophilus]TDP12972.1 alpha-D-ribose 1-methylphosphonate 5-triphosphate synthase subunit PhnG [Roseateles asaccharophilus]
MNSRTEAPSPDPEAAELVAQRQRWLGILAQAPRAALALHGQRVLADYRFEALRAPEAGLLMLRARASNSGARFNLAEATVTRCALRYRPAAAAASVGVGYVLGRDEERARWVAALDALLQQADQQALLLSEVIAPLQAALDAQRAAERARVAASQVRFFTLQAEGAAA